MDIIVQKFGGTSVKDEAARIQALKHVQYAVDQGDKVIVVVSAIGRKGAPYATDSLLGLVGAEHSRLTNRELDMLVPVPIRFWLKDEMYDWAKQIINDSQTDQYFNKDYFLKLLDDHKAGVRDNSRKLWTVLTFMMWHRLYVESDHLMDSPDAHVVKR
ncbi:hypothetical protein WP50_25730 [Lactiplantibacillus plantarum]|nr:hypothetical protein WP50_25730 [Lactiplantibacillus plantarum]